MPVGATKEAPADPYVMVPAPLIVVKIYPVEAGLVLAVGVMQSVSVQPERVYTLPGFPAPQSTATGAVPGVVSVQPALQVMPDVGEVNPPAVRVSPPNAPIRYPVVTGLGAMQSVTVQPVKVYALPGFPAPQSTATGRVPGVV